MFYADDVEVMTCMRQELQSLLTGFSLACKNMNKQNCTKKGKCHLTTYSPMPLSMLLHVRVLKFYKFYPRCPVLRKDQEILLDSFCAFGKTRTHYKNQGLECKCFVYPIVQQQTWTKYLKHDNKLNSFYLCCLLYPEDTRKNRGRSTEIFACTGLINVHHSYLHLLNHFCKREG